MSSLRGHPFRIFYGPADNPLDNFYLPALSASVRYDRSAGYFSSSALAVAAAGVARLIQNGGRMRLLVGAELSQADAEAIRQGHDLQERLQQRLLERFPDPQDALMRERLEVLAWMVAEGTLEIKVVLPKDTDGLPIPAHLTADYYHAKSGIFTDLNGDQVGFTGSINESETAWRKNYEQFMVFTSWGEGAAFLPHVVQNFERLWNGREPDWIAVEIPRAVRDHLLRYRPLVAPTRDPLEPESIKRACKEKALPYIAGSPQAERLLFQFLRDAPYLTDAGELGAATSAITPWPHQARVARRILERFPESAMLCDEVGLGKTIEAGLVLRQLLLSRRVRRCLILAPRSVLKQWQEELYEKFALNIPRYEGGKFLDVADHALPVETTNSGGQANPWDVCDVLLASSQLAKRNDRRAQIMAARGWDLLLVDEAHHARRKDFKERIYRPNQLLSLLNELKAAGKFAGLLLMTATPMQVHPLEVWDLLSLTGMGGRWGADEDNFLDFFIEMRKPFGQIDWEFVYDMVRDHLETGGQIEDDFRLQALAEIGPVGWASLEELPGKPGRRTAIIRQLGARAEPHVKEMARRHTPLDRLIYRNTRLLLREYQRRGILKDSVPRRKPRIERVEMCPEELALYNRIDEYITHFYHKYENERRGLGFVMTVYRRRLTSSFYAVRCSLERRLAYLKGQLDPESQFDNDDLEQDELELDVSEQAVLDPVHRDYFQAEVEYVQDFIQQLRLLAINDSKLEVLKAELDRVFRQRNTVLIFTQYTDTMDHLREQLREVYGSQIACYSGRGGEVWNGIAWAPATKEWVKTAFREGKIRILLGTESASEGLNLQTCGVLLNYDMPWNPMRVEQRIGRIDRIGQEHKEVWITNYFYKGTLEDQIYQRLADRIHWFEVVVGELQPILAEVGEATRRLAMLPPNEREAQLEQEIAALRQRLQNREVESLNLDEYLIAESYQPGPDSPVTLEQIEYMLTGSQATGCLFQPHPEIERAYLLAWKGERLPVTFSPKVFDEHPDTVRFLSYGSPLLAEILESVPQPETADAGSLARCCVEGELDLRAWYAVDSTGMEAIGFDSFMAFKDWLERADVPPANPRLAELAKASLQQHHDHLLQQQAQVIQHRRKAEYLTLRVRAQTLLLRAAMVEIALGRSPELFETDVYPSAFNEQAVLGLRRHGFPWAPLLRLAYEPGLRPQEESDYYTKIAGDKRDSLKGRFNQLTQEAQRIILRLNEAQKAQEQVENDVMPEIRVEPFTF